MSTAGIIAEYNPFHNGHAFHLKRAKEAARAQHIIVVMSGNYVQRGEPAIIDKYDRAAMAVKNGADLVLELPVCYSCAGAELFARAAVQLLDKTGVADTIVFGCENDNLRGFKDLARVLTEEPEEYRRALKNYLKRGRSYPAARKSALIDIGIDKNTADLLDFSNNILAVEYMKALIKTGSDIRPVPVLRNGAGHNEPLADRHYEPPTYRHNEPRADGHYEPFTDGHNEPPKDGHYASAAEIRKILLHETSSENRVKKLSRLVPENTLKYYENRNSFVTINDFSPVMVKSLFYDDDFSRYADISSFLSNRIRKMRDVFTDTRSFIRRLLTKNETKTHIARALTHIMLEITKDDLRKFNDEGYVPYARVLAANPSGMALLREIKQKAGIPLVGRFGSFYKSQTGASKKMLDINLRADSLYRYVTYTKTGNLPRKDFFVSPLKS